MMMDEDSQSSSDDSGRGILRAAGVAPVRGRLRQRRSAFRCHSALLQRDRPQPSADGGGGAALRPLGEARQLRGAAEDDRAQSAAGGEHRQALCQPRSRCCWI